MVQHPGDLPQVKLRRSKEKVAYEKAVDWMNMMLNAQLDVVVDGDDMVWTVTDGRRVASITFDTSQTQHNDAREEYNAVP